MKKSQIKKLIKEEIKHLIKEDVYYEPDRERMKEQRLNQKLKDLEEWVEQWVDDSIGLESANFNIRENQYDTTEIIIYIGQSKIANRSLEGDPKFAKQVWLETAEDLVHDLNNYISSDSFRVYNSTERSCVVSGPADY